MQRYIYILRMVRGEEDAVSSAVQSIVTPNHRRRYACDDTHGAGGDWHCAISALSRALAWARRQAARGQVQGRDYMSPRWRRSAIRLNLEYELMKESQAAHAHAYLDDPVSEGFLRSSRKFYKKPLGSEELDGNASRPQYPTAERRHSGSWRQGLPTSVGG